MIQKVLALFLILTLANDNGKCFRIESIVGGYRPMEDTFKYQISLNIKLRPNRTESMMACTGAIIHKKFAITIATCVIRKTVIQQTGVFFRRWYKIAVGTHDFNQGNALQLDVEEIFVPAQFDPYTHEADLAVIKMTYELDFHRYPQLDVLDLPDENTVDENILTAVASGYGYIWIEPNGGGRTYYQLKYVKVNVTTVEACKSFFGHHTDSLLCAKTVPDYPRQRWGLCRGDAGAPLVNSTKLLGLANRARNNCVDTVIPSIYTRIKPYVEFIRSVLDESPPSETRRFTNPFESEIVAAA